MTGKFIENLETILKEDLPGQKAHYKMAPLRKVPDLPLSETGKASVLILLYSRRDELWTLFIKRTIYRGHHSGQVSFPGGKKEKHDTSPEHTALREANEETGVDPSKIRILGTLTPLHIPVSNIEVLPVVGYTDNEPEFRISEIEVEYLIEVPLNELMNKMTTEKKLVINSEIIKVPGYLVQNEYIWGATAMILSEFIEIVSQAYVNR
jgi:8-oxo-dGTP pyrophosphatase MutT (NUDIX family)